MLKKHFWLINLLFFQAIWAVCAFYNGLAVLVSCLFLLLHLAITPSFKRDVLLAIVGVTIGSLLDSALVKVGLIQLKNGAELIPLWLVLLWAYFATTYNHALTWLKSQSRYTVFLIGAVAGPFSYFSAAYLGVFNYQTQFAFWVMIHSVCWGVLNVMFVKIGHYLDHEISHQTA